MFSAGEMRSQDSKEKRVTTYLFRESDVKAGPFIISYVKNSSVSHLVTPNKNGKFIRQTLEEAVDIAADIIACSDSFHYPALVTQHQVRIQDLPTKMMKQDVIVAVLQPRIRER